MGERDDRVAAFGRWLSQERELRGLPRDDVARLTRLAPGIVEALESGDAARMPPRAYLLGYLRSYAAVVGLDADDLVLRWQEADGAEEPHVPAPPLHHRRAPRRRLLLGAALAVALAGLLAAWAASGRPRTLSLPDRGGKALQKAPYIQP